MNSRLDNITDETLTTSLTQIRADLDELKQRQRTSAQSGVLSYFVQTDDEWDVQLDIGTDADTSHIVKNIFVQYLGDSSQEVAFSTVAFTVFVNGTDAAHELSPAVTSWTDGTRTASITYLPPTISQVFYQAHAQISTLKHVTLYVKGYATSSQSGFIDVVVL